MAYRLKTVRYQGSDRRILLQNENGPCPLLAAANALLLRGSISLPSECIRNGCASLEEVVNMLAVKAMNFKNKSNNKSDNNSNDDKSTTTTTDGDDQAAIHDLLDVIPKLQYGMDVNPKFTSGPVGMEFTKELTTFDLLNVRMVHGWLLDPQSEELTKLVGSKTYNELIEIVIHGNEATAELHKLETQLEKLKDCSDDVWLHIGVPADQADDNNASAVEATTAKNIDQQQPSSSSPSPDASAENNTDSDVVAKKNSTAAKRQSVGQLRSEFKEKATELSKRAQMGSLINDFLESSGHQLTQYGLARLYEHLEENELCVFFRNNHFSTLTKHDSLLYLLVTDLGYANVPNVVWEKIDVIDGDTEYVDAAFRRPAPLAELSAKGQSAEGFSNLDPDQLLAQRGQAEADYQLALQLSGKGSTAAAASGSGGGGGLMPVAGGGGTAAGAAAGKQGPKQTLAEQEGTMMGAALEASLRAYNGMDDGIKAQAAQAPSPKQQQSHHDASGATTQEDQDHLLAMQLHAQMEQEDLRLAKQMQESEWSAQRQAAPATQTAAAGAAEKNSGCVIS